MDILTNICLGIHVCSILQQRPGWDWGLLPDGYGNDFPQRPLFYTTRKRLEPRHAHICVGAHGTMIAHNYVRDAGARLISCASIGVHYHTKRSMA